MECLDHFHLVYLSIWLGLIDIILLAFYLSHLIIGYFSYFSAFFWINWMFFSISFYFHYWLNHYNSMIILKFFFSRTLFLFPNILFKIPTYCFMDVFFFLLISVNILIHLRFSSPCIVAPICFPPTVCFVSFTSEDFL